MSHSKPVTLNLLDKDYVVACPDDECDDLLSAAAYLNHKMQEVREGGKVVSTERIAVMAALNIVHELLQHKQEKVSYNYIQEDEVQRLEDKIASALQHTSSI